uniref:Sushi domain-containing protein n=1 Tax=Macrostomum lignano TaxID=282301 RepID=A0A1I8GXY0_9PLAT
LLLLPNCFQSSTGLDNNDSLVELFASYNDDAESECADGWHNDSRSDEGVPVEDENAIAEPTAVQFACGQSWPSQLPMSMAPVTQYCQASGSAVHIGPELWLFDSRTTRCIPRAERL